jgi:hypothetical protein
MLADNGMTVNGNNVEALSLFVEHYQKTEVAWNGQNGKIICQSGRHLGQCVPVAHYSRDGVARPAHGFPGRCRPVS